MNSRLVSGLAVGGIKNAADQKKNDRKLKRREDLQVSGKGRLELTLTANSHIFYLDKILIR
jgi:hypothetical protein